MDDGAIVRRVTEGRDLSALLGEEELDLPGQHSVLLRSSHLGRVGTTARIELLAPTGATGLRMLQLSEVEASIEVLVVQDGRTELPVHTGGFAPALKTEHAPIHEHVQITHEAPLLGDFVQVYAPVEPGWLELARRQAAAKLAVSDIDVALDASGKAWMPLAGHAAVPARILQFRHGDTALLESAIRTPHLLFTPRPCSRTPPC